MLIGIVCAGFAGVPSRRARRPSGGASACGRSRRAGPTSRRKSRSPSLKSSVSITDTLMRPRSAGGGGGGGALGSGAFFSVAGSIPPFFQFCAFASSIVYLASTLISGCALSILQKYLYPFFILFPPSPLSPNPPLAPTPYSCSHTSSLYSKPPYFPFSC